MYLIRFSKKADKDKRNIKSAGLEKKTRDLLQVIREDPFQTPPPFEALVGNLSGFYSRRINIQHRLVYSVHPEENTIEGITYEGTIHVLRLWTHYERI